MRIERDSSRHTSGARVQFFPTSASSASDVDVKIYICSMGRGVPRDSVTFSFIRLLYTCMVQLEADRCGTWITNNEVVQLIGILASLVKHSVCVVFCGVT